VLSIIALASSKGSFAKTIEVTKDSNLPASIHTSIPRDGKTWFYGKIPSGFRKSETWLHLYSIPTRRRVRQKDEHSSLLFNPNDYVLDTWQRVSSARKVRFRRLNSVQLSGSQFLQDIPLHTHPSLVSAKAFSLWLRESTKQTPVIRLNFHVRNDVNSNSTDVDVLIVFRNGFQNRPSVQQFVNFSELLESTWHDYSHTDEQGILMIKRRSSKSKAMDDTPVKTETFFRWTGQSFRAEPIVPKSTVIR
jgi:hypothetical protein